MLKVIRSFERTCSEIDALEKATSTAAIKQLFIERHQFAKVRHELVRHIDQHYINVLLKAQIPVIGLLYESHSKYTTKTSLEGTDLLQRYNSGVQKYTWLKPYSVA